jgi:hypothetical protein
MTETAILPNGMHYRIDGGGVESRHAETEGKLVWATHLPEAE